ncbi:MAG: heme-binding protein [Leptolyngbyaceae cyanobacterium]
MRWRPGVVLFGIGAILAGGLFLGAYSAASAPVPDGFPPPTAQHVIELKQYPAYRAATIAISGDLDSAPAQAFSPLYEHISSNQISMTAPVETRYPTTTLDADFSEGKAVVSFLYQSLDVVPESVTPNIQIEDMPPTLVVSLVMRGSYRYEMYTESLQKLQDWLLAHPDYRVAGTPRRLFYDGPFVPTPFKRSEVQIPVQPQ